MIPGIVAGGLAASGADPFILPHRYWRIRDARTPATAAFTIVEMYEDANGLNQCGGGTAIASSNNAAYLPAEAFDGLAYDEGTSAATIWASTNENNPWIGYDFGAGNEKAIVAIGAGSRWPTHLSQTPTNFDVQYSDDGTTWTTAWSEASISWNALEFKKFVNPAHTPASYSGSPWGAHTTWRIQGVKRSGGYADAHSVSEMEHRATPGGADQCSGGTASASSSSVSPNPASNAFDNNNATRWASNTNVPWSWVQYVHSSPVEVGQVAIRSIDETFFTQVYGAFLVQVLVSGVWTTCWYDNSADGLWARNELRTFTDPAYV